MFNARSIKNKLVELAELLSNVKYKIVAITETWTDNTVTDSMLISHPCNSKRYPYTVFRKDRNGSGGGVCVLVHNSLVASPVSLPVQFSDLEIVAIDVCTNSTDKQRILCVYNPRRDVQVARNMADCISALCTIPFTSVVVGDFNLPEIDWGTFVCPEDGVHNVLLDCFLSNSMTQFVTHPTRDQNVLDLVLCSDENNIADVLVSTVPFPSDHYSVSFSINSVFPSTEPRFVKDWKRADYDGISAFLSCHNWNALFEHCKDVEAFNEVFLGVMRICIDKYVPLRKLKRGFGFRLPRKLRKLRARKKLLWKNRSATVDGRRMYNDCCRDFSRRVKVYSEKLENRCVHSGDTKAFFDFANSKLKSKQGVAPLRRVDGSICTENTEKVEILNSFFVSVFTEDNGSTPIFEKRVKDGVNLKNVNFTPAKVCKILKSLPNKMSRSPDHLPALFLKNVAKKHTCTEVTDGCLCEPLSRIFSVSFCFGVLH